MNAALNACCEPERADRLARTLCMMLAYAGCRRSEALALTADRLDLAADVLVTESTAAMELIAPPLRPTCLRCRSLPAMGANR